MDPQDIKNPQDMKQDLGIKDKSVIVEEPGLPRDLYAYLAKANLLRMRGCWEEAVQTCMAALRLSPESHSAQSLLGDIYENQGRHDDAAQWYRMALDINPDSPADRIKLDRLLRLQEELPRASESARLMAASVGASVPLPALSLRRSWNPDKLMRYAAITAAVFVLVVVTFAYLAANRHSAMASLGLPDQEVKTQSVVVPALGGPAAPSAVRSARDAGEQALINTLNASHDLSAHGLTVYDIVSDPRSAGQILTFGVSPDAVSALTQEAVLRDALRTVQAAANVPGEQTVSVWTVRCLMVPPASGSAGAALVFVGDIPRSSLPALPPPDAVTTAQVQGLFSNLWWSAQISG